jgi:cellulose 1,4-beta-cellobiosidase
MAESGGAFSVLASSLTSTEYLANSLSFGTTYDFKVESRNSYGYSAYSSTTSLLCAYIPDHPATVTTTNTNDQVTVSWSDPVANG